MRIRAITPIVVPPEELARRQARYTSLAPVGVTIDVDNLASGPDRLESEEQIRESEGVVYEQAMDTDPGKYDGIFLDCVLDPALEPLQADSGIRVFGITRIVTGYLDSLGLRMMAVARNQPIADELTRRVEAFGFGSSFDGVLVLDLSLDDISDTARWNEALARVLAREKVSSVDAVINGCSAAEVRPLTGPVVLDPTALSLRLMGSGLDLVDRPNIAV